jgi:hypothetical protein
MTFDSLRSPPATYVHVVTPASIQSVGLLTLASNMIQIIYIVLLAQEVANHLLQKSTAVEIAAAAGKEATEVELAGKALQAIEWLSYAMRLGESLREEPKSLEGVGNVDEIKVRCWLRLSCGMTYWLI